jgi:hypothetical protein
VSRKIEWTRGRVSVSGLNAVRCNSDGRTRRFEEMPAADARSYLEWLLSFPGVERTYAIPELWRFWSHEDRLVRLLSFHTERILRGRLSGAALSADEKVATREMAQLLSQDLTLLLDPIQSEQGLPVSPPDLSALIQAVRSHSDDAAIEAMSELAKMGLDAFPALRYVLRNLRAGSPERVKASLACCEAISGEVDLRWLVEVAGEQGEERTRENSRAAARDISAKLREQLLVALSRIKSVAVLEIGGELARPLMHPSARVRRAVRRMLRIFVETCEVNIQSLIPALRVAETLLEHYPASADFSFQRAEVQEQHINAMTSWVQFLRKLRARRGLADYSEQVPETTAPQPESKVSPGNDAELLKLLREPNPRLRIVAIRELIARPGEVSPEEFEALRDALSGIPARWLDFYGVLPGTVGSFEIIKDAQYEAESRVAWGFWMTTAQRVRAIESGDFRLQIQALEKMLQTKQKLSPEEFEVLRKQLKGSPIIGNLVMIVLALNGPPRDGERRFSKPRETKKLAIRPLFETPVAVKLEAEEALDEVRLERLKALRDRDPKVQIMALEEMLAGRDPLSFEEFEVLRSALRGPEGVKWRAIEVLGNADRLLPGLRECLQLQAASDDPRTAARAQAALERLPQQLSRSGGIS